MKLPIEVTTAVCSEMIRQIEDYDIIKNTYSTVKEDILRRLTETIDSLVYGSEEDLGDDLLRIYTCKDRRYREDFLRTYINKTYSNIVHKAKTAGINNSSTIFQVYTDTLKYAPEDGNYCMSLNLYDCDSEKEVRGEYKIPEKTFKAIFTDALIIAIDIYSNRTIAKAQDYVTCIKVLMEIAHSGRPFNIGTTE